MDESLISRLNKIVASRITSGVVILDDSGEILYLNDEARSILSAFISRKLPADCDPETVNEAIVQSLKKHLGSLSKQEGSCIHCSDSDATYSIRTLPLHKPHGEEKPCLMVLIEGVTVHRKFDIKAVQSQFGLSKRESEVTFCLTKGLTNKEIAKALSLSPETVRDYIKQIMKKLNTTTRAGIVGKVLP